MANASYYKKRKCHGTSQLTRSLSLFMVDRYCFLQRVIIILGLSTLIVRLTRRPLLTRCPSPYNRQCGTPTPNCSCFSNKPSFLVQLSPLRIMQAPSFFVNGSSVPPAGSSLPYARTDVRMLGLSSMRVVRLRESMPEIPARASRQKARATHDPYR